MVTGMKKANYKDKPLVVDILSASFKDNKSVNYILPQASNKEKRLRRLMAYSFDVCFLFGNVLLSDDGKAAALIIYPDKKRATLKSVWLDLKFAIRGLGIFNLFKAIRRESAIKKLHPAIPFSYLWFIGVKPENQNAGSGTILLREIMHNSRSQNCPVLLETSTERNLPWYKKNQFDIYAELDFGYRLYCLRSN
jgi:ribosomal protein S18 acetylase RimI-like enzyme